MYQNTAHCPSSTFNVNYGSHDHYGGKSSCSHGHAHGPSDMPVMSINLEFSADVRQQPRSTMMPEHGGGDHVHLRLQCDQVYGNVQPKNYTPDPIGRQHCCCHQHVPPQPVVAVSAPEFMHPPQSMNYPQSMSHLQPMNYPQSGVHPQPMSHPQRMNYPQKVNHPLTLTYPQTIAHPQQINHSQAINPPHPMHHSQAINSPHPINQTQSSNSSQAINYIHPLNPPAPRNNFQCYMPSPYTSEVVPPQKHYISAQSDVQSAVNCASTSININIGGVSCPRDNSMFPNHDAGSLRNADHTLDWDKQRIPGKPENIPPKSVPVSDEYLNCLNAITRSHAEWFGHSTDGASQISSNSLFNATFPQNSDVIECPWLPTNLDDKDFRLVLIFLHNKSRQPVHCVN